MKKSIWLIAIIATILIIIILCNPLKSKSYDLSIRAEIKSNSGKELIIKGFPDNPKGRRGQYIIDFNSRIKIFDTNNNVIDFSSLKPGNIITVWYTWRIPADDTDNFEDMLLLEDNQRIPKVSSITINKEQ